MKRYVLLHAWNDTWGVALIGKRYRTLFSGLTEAEARQKLRDLCA